MRTIASVIPALLCLMLVACNRHAVSLRETNARDEVPALGNLVFRFNQSLIPDSLLNRWDSTDFVKFEPAVKGRFRWEAPDMLVFSPLSPLPPATHFTARFNSEILRYSKFDKVETKGGIKFHTASARLENSYVAWARPDGGQPAPILHLEFNYPVAPESLNGLLDVKSEDKSCAFVLRSASPSEHMEVRLTDIPLQDKDIPLNVRISKKLIPVGGKNEAEDDLSSELTVPSPFVLNIVNVDAQHDGTTGSVHVRISQPVTEQGLRNFIRFHPAVSYDITMLDDGFLITSEGLDAEKAYELHLLKGMRGTIGGELKENYSQQLAFGDLEPMIEFANRKGMYLGKYGSGNIEVKIVNTPRVKILVSKVYESNLLAAQRYGYYPRSSSDEDEEYYYGGGDFTLGDVIYEKEVETASLPKYGNSRLFSMSLEDRITDFRGIYHIQIRSMENYWISDSRFVSLSDLGIIAKEGTDEMFVAVQSIRSATPAADAQLTLYGGNNQVLGVGQTDADGVGRIQYLRRDPSGFRPAMLVVKTGDDFNYLPFNTTRVNTSRFEVGGKKMNPSGLDAFVYAERDIYRPGETFNYAIILRDLKWKVPGELPLKLRFVMPNGKEWTTIRKSLNSEGALEGNMPIPAAALTGTYNFEVYSTNDVLLAAYPFQVEEFVPDRIRVKAETGLKELAPGQTATVSVQADYFFGQPAANRKYETEIQVRQLAFRSRKYPNFRFELVNQDGFWGSDIKEGTTDAGGKASVSYAFPAEYKNRGLMQVAFYTTVFDESGRPVSRHEKLPVYTQKIFFGLEDDDYGYYSLNQPVRFPIIALDKNDQVQSNAKARVKVIRREFRTVLSRSGGYFRYESQPEDKLIEEKEISVSGEQTGYSFIPREPGRYEIRIYVPGASSYVSKTFYSYGAWGASGGNFDVNTDGHVDIVPDKTTYNPGDRARILLKAPFDGRMLVTLENNGVKEYKMLDVQKRTAVYEFTVSAELLPNAFITATLVKPHQLSDLPLTVAHGFRSLRVEEANRKIKVELVAAESTRSNRKQTIKVKAAPGSLISIAAVDNGILQVSDFKTPDPYAYFYQQRALAVNSYDLYPFLLPELRQRTSSTGGGGGLSMERRINPIVNKRFKMVSFWSGFKQADGSGNAEFEIDIPGFSGELRLMAVSLKDNRFGAGSSVMKVADPLVVSTSLPRFLTPGDTIDVPVTVMNTTTSSAALNSGIEVRGPLKIIGPATAQTSVDGKGEARLLYRLAASGQPGEAAVKVRVKGLNDSFGEDIDITVRPASTLQKRTASGVVSGSGSRQVQLPVSDFMAGTASYKFVAGNSPLLEWGVQLSNLLQYPFGCTEQTVAAAFPQLYYTDLASVLGKKNVSGAAASNVMEAIRVIKMRQLYNGAVMMWDNGSEENWWATAFAAHFLIEAEKAGFTVDKKLLDPMLSYLTFRLRNRQLINYTYNRDQQKKVVPRELPYSLYVLSLAGRPQIATMNYYKEHPEWLTLDSRYMLAAAFAAGGDKARAKEVLPASYSGEVGEKETGGSFASPVRNEALALLMLLDAQPQSSEVSVLAKRVANALKTERWLSTQEHVFSILALGKLARSAGSGDLNATILADGRQVGSTNGEPVVVKNVVGKSGALTIQTKGSGNLYYFYEASGISATGDYTEEDQSVRVRRRFYSRTGAALGNSFGQNDLIIVAVTVENQYRSKVENMVITDLLPACFEIENPRIKDLPDMNWIKDGATPTAMDIRDDRIHFFIDLTRAKQTYYYAVRAVSPGVFRMGPVSAEAMYDGSIHSYHGAGTVTVK